jgi:NADH dehydrogenase
MLIIGANFAGLKAALSLPPYHCVSVFDPQPDFEYLPNIHELLSQIKKPSLLRCPRQQVIEKAGHRFIQQRIEQIDADKGIAVSDDGRPYPFEACLVAVGGINNTYGVPGAERFSMPFKSVSQCHAIGLRLMSLFQKGLSPTIVIVGGGLEGIEALGEILRRYRHHPNYRLHLIESGSRLLNQAPEAVATDIRYHCRSLPVKFHTRTHVKWMEHSRLGLSTEKTLNADAIIWTGGATAAPLLRKSGLCQKANQWAPVSETLQSRIYPNVFVAGDAAELPSPLSKQAYYALQTGLAAAKNMRRYLENKPLLKLRPSPKPMLVSFGDLQTYAIFGKTVLAGPSLAGLKEAAFHRTLSELDASGTMHTLIRAYHRYASSLKDLILPAALSFSALRRLPGVRIL